MKLLTTSRAQSVTNLQISGDRSGKNNVHVGYHKSSICSYFIVESAKRRNKSMYRWRERYAVTNGYQGSGITQNPPSPQVLITPQGSHCRASATAGIGVEVL